VLYGANGKAASATYSNGMTETWTYNPDNSLHEVAYAGVTGQVYTALENDYDASGKLAISNATNTDGTHTITGHENGLTLAGTSGNDTIIGGGQDQTFSFTGAFGHDTLADFNSHIAGDTLSLSGAAFINNFTQLLAATTFSASGAIITVDANDTISIPGLNHATMAANPGSFSFHS
jgi:hypothetical protein